MLRLRKKSNRGITLIALVITIIVLLILAAVSIATLTGENGILTKANDAKEMTNIADIKEQVKMDILEEQMKNNSGYISKEKLIEILKRYFDEENIPNADDEKWEDLGSIGKLHTLPKYGNYDIDITDMYDQDFSHTPKPGDIVAVPANKDWDINKVDPTLDEAGNIIPVPKGFDFVGGTEETGVVISDVQEDDLDNSKKGNQFVWVPVPNVILEKGKEVISRTYTPMATTYEYNGKIYYRGMLYEFEEGTTATYKLDYNVGTTKNREPSLVTKSESDLYAPMVSVAGTGYDAQYYSRAGGFTSPMEFGKQMQEDFDNMIKSVDKYKGFFVARYEMSLNGGKVEYKKGKEAEKSDAKGKEDWYGFYGKQKAFATDTKKSSVTSSMIWGSQYDAMMNWMARNNIPIGNKNIADHERNMTDITGGVNDGKVESTDVLNNVYDLLGNLQEWTLEAKSTYVRAYRGGWRLAYSFSPGYRGYYSEIAAVDDMGSRGTLCIQD